MTDEMKNDAMAVTLRPAHPGDEEFLYELFCETMGDGLAALDAAQRDTMLRMQFKAQILTYSAQFPAADNQIILLGDRAIGRIMVERTDAEIQGVDLALLRECRNAGVGTIVLENLLDEAARTGRSFLLSVVKTNPALRLYERLGFKTTGDTGTQFQMEWVAEN